MNSIPDTGQLYVYIPQKSTTCTFKVCLHLIKLPHDRVENKWVDEIILTMENEFVFIWIGMLLEGRFL